jgi:DNA repair protein RecO (recombination protein O)
MDERSTGIILRTRLLTETSLIVHWLTRDFGRIATVAKGARRAKSPFLGKLDLFYLADLSFRRSQRSELHNLSEVNVREFNSPLRTELTYLQQAAYFVNLIELTTETEAAVPILFEILQGALNTLSSRAPDPTPVLAFEIKLLTEHGLQPDLSRTRLSAGAKGILLRMIQADWPMISRLRLTSAQSIELNHYLEGALIQHFEKVPLGRNNALAVSPTKSL